MAWMMDGGVQLIFGADRDVGRAPVVESDSPGDGISGRSGPAYPTPCAACFTTVVRPSVMGAGALRKERSLQWRRRSKSC